MASTLKMMVIQQGLLCGVLGKSGLGLYHMLQPSEYYDTVTVTRRLCLRSAWIVNAEGPRYTGC